MKQAKAKRDWGVKYINMNTRGLISQSKKHRANVQDKNTEAKEQSTNTYPKSQSNDKSSCRM